VRFSASAAVTRNGVTVGYSQDIYSLVFRESTIKNSTNATVFPRIDGVGAYIVGFYGDVAVG
jgi:hypothetical protein